VVAGFAETLYANGAQDEFKYTLKPPSEPFRKGTLKIDAQKT
jgi:hypothetical protein